MRPTVVFLNAKFDEFNEMMFGGALPRVDIRLSRASSYMGQLRYTLKKHLFGAPKINKITLSISILRDCPQSVVEDTLLHEMIHLYILVGNLRDTSAHGAVFRRIMDTINTRYGRHINISHKASGDGTMADERRRRHLICVSRLKNGKTCITVTTAASIFRLWRDIAGHYAVESADWFVSTDPFFNRFPRSRTIKFYVIEPQELDQRRNGMRRLCYENGRIFTPRD